MTQKIHPYLILRLNAVVAAFNDLDAGVGINRNNYTHIAATSLKEKDGDGSGGDSSGSGSMNANIAKKSGVTENNWQEIIKGKDDDSDDSGGGGGTMRGHRAKNSALDPKALMRRMTRR